MSVIESRESWLLARASGIGASEIAAVVGLSPYMGPIDLWLLKTGQLEREQLDSDLLWFGTALEPIIARRYEMLSGEQVLRGTDITKEFANVQEHVLSPHGENVIVARADAPWMMCTPDGIVANKQRGLEMKNCRFKGEEWGAAGTDHVPDHFRIQTTWQMAVCNFPEWDLVPFFNGNHLETFRIRRDFDLEGELIEAGRAFWHDNVLAGVPPKVDESESYGRYLGRKYSLGTKTEVPCTPLIETLAIRMREAARAERAAQDAKRLATNEMMLAIGDAGGSRTPIGKVGWVRPKPSQVTDWQALALHMGADDEDKQLFTSERPGTAYLRGWFSSKEEE
jgi:predicted phage-related endonuclease